MNMILTIGRSRIYPYFCILMVVLAFLYTDPFSTLNWRYIISLVGAVTGLLCVILLAKRNNAGNVMGMIAVCAECVANFLGNNIGAGLPTFYYFGSHIYGLFTWHRHRGEDNLVQVRTLNERSFLGVIIFLIVGVFFNIYLTGALGVDNTIYQLIINSFIFGLGVVAQLLLMMRFSFNWYLWVILNILVIGLNIYTDNPIIATQYLIYFFNAIYGICEWKKSQLDLAKQMTQNTASV